jgi:hypothetical protein
MPVEIIDRLNGEINAGLASSDIKDEIRRSGNQAGDISPLSLDHVFGARGNVRTRWVENPSPAANRQPVNDHFLTGCVTLRQQPNAIPAVIANCHFARRGLSIGFESVRPWKLRAVSKRLVFGAIVMVAIGLGRAVGADGPSYKPVKAAPKGASYAWTGFYIGSHLGYATGYSRWSATEPG